jgi:Tol biopolymer transport system component
LTRLTRGDDDWFGLFSPDGTRILFTGGEAGRFNIAAVSADGTTEWVTKSPHWQKATSFWPRGPVVLINDIPTESGRSDIFELRLDQPAAQPRPLVATEAADVEAVFSPDGRFIAYEQTVDGAQEVYIQRYPGGPRTRVSVDGGRRPVWNPKGGEIFFGSAKGTMAVPVRDGVPVATPTVLFEELGDDQGAVSLTWAVSPDGSRFLFSQGRGAAPINVVTNWFEELKAKVPPAR